MRRHWDFSCPAASLLDSVLPPPSSGADSAKEATVSYAHFLQVTANPTRCRFWQVWSGIVALFFFLSFFFSFERNRCRFFCGSVAFFFLKWGC